MKPSDVKFVLWVLLAVCTVVAGAYEVPDVYLRDHLPENRVQAALTVFNSTHYFRFLLPASFTVYTFLAGRKLLAGVSYILSLYIQEPYLFLDHMLITTFSTGTLLIAIAAYRNWHNYDNFTKDPAFLFGTQFCVGTSGLWLGASLGQKRQLRQSIAQPSTTLQDKILQLEGICTEYRRKIVALHQLISSIRNSPTIPPDLYP